MVLVMVKPVPEVCLDFDFWLEATAREATAKMSAAITSAVALACPAAFVRPNFFTFTYSSVLQPRQNINRAVNCVWLAIKNIVRAEHSQHQHPRQHPAGTPVPA
jgi:hypothetical protein